MFLQALIPVVVHVAAKAEFESVVANPLKQSRIKQVRSTLQPFHRTDGFVVKCWCVGIAL